MPNFDMAMKRVYAMKNLYFKKFELLTDHALERCEEKFLIGYTDLHPRLDCVAAWRDPFSYVLI